MTLYNSLYQIATVTHSAVQTVGLLHSTMLVRMVILMLQSILSVSINAVLNMPIKMVLHLYIQLLAMVTWL